MTEHVTPQQHDSDDRLQLLIEITSDLDMDLDKLLAQILNRLKTVMPGADIGVVYLYDNLQEALIPRSCLGYDQQAMRNLKLFAGESISGRVFQQGIALITQSREDVEQSGGSLNAENDRHYRKAIGDRTITSNICAPLTIGEQTTIGTITLSSTHSPFAPKDLDLLTAIAGRISQTIYQSRLVEQLRQSEARYRTLVEDLPVGISETSPTGLPLYFNPQALAINGYSPDEINQINVQDLYVHPQDREHLVKSLNAKGHYSYEHQLRRKDGRLIWVRGSTQAVKNETGEIVRYLGIQEDITQERQIGAIRRAVERLRREIWTMRSERDIAQVLVAMRQVMETQEIPFTDCGINVIDDLTAPPTVRFHSMSPEGQWLQTSGDKGASRILRFWREGHTVYRPDLQTDDPYNEQEAIHSLRPKPVRSVADIPFTYGTLAFNSVTPNAFSPEHIAFMEELSSVLDECFRRLEDLKLIDAKEEQLRIAQKMEAVGHLAGGIAHDFNNLNTVIIGNLTYLLNDLNKDDARHEDALDAYEAAKRCSTLVEQLLAFSARKVSTPQTIGINATVRELHKILRRLIGEDIELENDLDPKAGTIYIDRSQLEQVLLNMALNARDAMPDGGKLLVRTRPLYLGDNLFRKLAELTAGHYALIEVTDTGTGMDENTRSRIFDPFFTTKEFGKGTGLGLATAYGIIKQAGGTIDVTSIPGEGTSFLIYLPTQQGQAPHAPIEDQQNKAHGEETILVVEDEPGVLKLAKRMLERNGFTAIEAASPLEAIALVNHYPYAIDLLLTDVVMPDMSGPELVKQLKPLHPEMQVVYMSAYASERFSSEIDQDALLRKPFSEGTITVKVRQTLDMAHS